LVSRKTLGARGDVLQNLGHCARERTRGEHRLLRATEFRRGNHLERLGDLLRVLHAADTAANVYERGHGRWTFAME
jgi:hypothetical protein